MEYARSSSVSGDEKVTDTEEDVSESSSSYSSSTAHQSSTTVSASGQSNGRPQKRKRSTRQDIDTCVSRRKRNYSVKYHNLFNNTIQDLQVDAQEPSRDDLHTGQVGISRWSPQEKGQLFRGIARCGRDNLPAIAALIGTKTELEVHVYLQVLQEASVKQHMYGKRRSLISTADIPAAFEVSDQCCNALEQAADALAALQRRHEEQHEKQKHADLWKLDQKTAQWADRRLSEGEEGRIEVCRRLPAAEVLDLNQFLKLSANVFMNSSEPDSNYRSFVSRFEKPSILYTAFADLYSLVVSITKRLIQSSLFFAMSRLRATQSSSYAHKQVVKQADVLAALKVVGMKENARDFWVKVPRRCRLIIHDPTNTAKSGEAMHYNEVEEFLAQAKSVAGKKFVSASSSETEKASSKQYGESCLESESESESQSIASSLSDTNSSDGSSSQSGTTSKSSTPGERFAKRTDLYLEHIDRKASRKEELRLWKILDRDPPDDMSVQKPSIKLKNPGPYRKNRDDMDDWRGWVDLRPEWEVYDIDNLDKELAGNRRQMRIRSAKIWRKDGRRRHTHRDHTRSRSRTLRPGESTPIDAASSSDQQSTALEEMSENDSSSEGRVSLDEEDFDDTSEYPRDEPPAEVGEDLKHHLYNDDNRLLLPSEEDDRISTDDESGPAGRQRSQSRHGSVSPFQDESKEESEDYDSNEEGRDMIIEDCTENSGEGSNSEEE